VSGVSGRLVLLAGGTSLAGRTIARRLLDAGARVIVVGSDDARLADASTELPAVRTRRCDLTDEDAVRALAADVRESVGRIDGLVHLVGGWRGGGGLAGQSDDDFRTLERGLTALRHATRAFDDDLRNSDAGRLAIVSSTAVARPLAGGANYAAVKAASEAWTRAVAQGFAKAARDTDAPPSAAATIFRVRALAGLEDTLAAAVHDLWSAEASGWNDRIVTLGEP